METPDWDSAQFVAWLQGQLRRRQWNAADLARRLNVPHGTVSRWLSGERRPNPRSSDHLADVLAVDPDLVLTMTGHRPSPTPVQPDDPQARIHALVDRVRLTPDRLAGLEATLLAWMELDRSAAPDHAPNNP